MALVLGIASVRAQEIPDSAKVKVKLDSLGVTAVADTLRAACDSLTATCDSLLKADAAKAQQAADKEVAGKEQDEARKVDLTDYTLKEVTDDTPADNGKRSKRNHAGLCYISLQGAPVLNYYENSFAFSEFGQTGKMFTLQGALSFGYDFSEAVGARLQVAYGNDSGACNVRETSSGKFYPYTFQHVNLFIDGILNLAGRTGEATSFRPKLYFGVGGAHTFGFSDSGHPWQKVSSPNTVFGFRGGFITEYCWDSGFGLFADLCAEGYTDLYNGLQPSKEDQAKGPGYAGFPLDLRALASFGIVFHF